MKKQLLFAILLLVVPQWLYAQPPSCSGTWGYPIVNQTFGQGNPSKVWYGPLATYAPGASTSTIFVGAAGPAGGQLSDNYSGLAKTPAASNQGNWVNIPDHTGDPNGLMLLINAPSTAATVFFEYSIDNLCPNTTFKLSVWVLNVNTTSLASVPGYQYPNMTMQVVDASTNAVLGSTATGNVPIDEVWHQYSIMFNNGTSTGIKFRLINNSIGSGYGNDLALDDITLQGCVPLTKLLPRVDTIMCNGVSLDFNANVSGSPYANPEYQWQYSTDAGLTWQNQGAPNSSTAYVFNKTTLPSGQYLVRYLTGPQGATGNVNCIAISDTSIIQLLDLPKTVLDKTICQGSTYYFYGRYLGLAGTYDTVVRTDIYDLCGSDIRLNLKVTPLPDVEIGAPKTVEICTGEVALLKVQRPIANTSYQWLNEGYAIPGETGSEFEARMEGVYSLTADLEGCRDTSGRILVKERPVPVATIISRNELACSFDTLNFQAEVVPGARYAWSPAQVFRSFAGEDGDHVSGVLHENTLVSLTVYNKFGCSGTDSVFTLVRPCCEVFTPNAFSPNQDGRNDYFIPSMQVGQLITTMRVFDRYGKIVYDSELIGKGWNGTYPDGTSAAPGVYMYHIRYTCSDNKPYEKRGDLTLIR